MSSEDVQHLVSPDAILAALKTYAGSKEVSIQKIQVSRGTEEIEGFTSIILRVSVDFSHNGEVQSQAFIVKRLPQVEAQIKLVAELNMFTKEVFYYNVVVPKLAKFIKSPLPLPTCYFAQNDGVNDMLILEDLKGLGYKTLGLGTKLSVEHCKIVMKELAKLHMASVAVEKEAGETLNNMFPAYKDDPYLYSDMSQTMMNDGAKLIVALCQEIPKFQNVSSVLENKLSTIVDQVCAVAKPQKDQQNVLCHGDCGIHNMMFIHDKNDQPLDVRFIDLQIIRYSSPFTDIMYFLRLSTSNDIRHKYLDELLNTYLISCNQCAQECGLHIKALTFDEVKKNYNSVRAFGVLFAAAFKPMFCMKNEVFPKDHNESNEKFENMFYGDKTSIAKAKLAKDEEFHLEICEIIKDLINFYDIKE